MQNKKASMKNQCQIPAAIYARFSTENQRDQSIEDQIRVCTQYAENNGYTVKPECIFCDEATSGTTLHRTGLTQLRQRAELGEFRAVIVFNFARLARDLHDILSVQKEFEYLLVDLISVAEGIKTSEPGSKMTFQMMGMMSQGYVDSVRRDTRNAQVGIIERGYLTGNLGYGYEVKKVGVLRQDNRGRFRADGSLGYIIPEEADVIRRIYNDFINGKSITAIVKELNQELVQSRYKRGWAESTVSKILKCETYSGLYIWGRTANVKNPRTGKKEKRDKPREEWIIKERPEMRIIDEETWKQAQARWTKIAESIASNDAKEGWGKRKSYVDAYPPYLLSGALKCERCGGAIVLVGGKGDGYYGCQHAYARKRCTNRKTISRTKLEKEFLQELKKYVLHPKAIQKIFESAERAIKEHFKDLPDKLHQQNRELEKLQSKIGNLVNYLAEGRHSESITKQLSEYESRQKIVEGQIREIKVAQQRIPGPPSEEAIKAKLENIQELLEKDVVKSAMLIREILGPITLDTKKDEMGKDYVDISAVLRALSLLSIFLQGSNSLTWWR